MKTLKNTITPEARAILETWLAGDYLLYNHFSAKLDRHIEEFGRARMDSELKRLKSLNWELYADCVKLKADKKDPGLNKKEAGGMKTVYGLKSDSEAKPWCDPYTRKETDYCKMIREDQTAKVNEMVLKGLIPPIP